ncbi:MAG: hypothetical protein E6G90_07665 [Alphaproteobacteria bacterium]|nr:MAG: hypothetical protein E6G90_07665 [Alphaproteobacteria bacterium]
MRRRTLPRLRRYARALTRNRDRAEDLVQDTLSRALDKERFWQTGTNLGAWLFTIMHNQHLTRSLDAMTRNTRSLGSASPLKSWRRR